MRKHLQNMSLGDGELLNRNHLSVGHHSFGHHSFGHHSDGRSTK